MTVLQPRIPRTFQPPHVLSLFSVETLFRFPSVPQMCNLYSQTKSQDAMRHLFDDMVEGG